MPGLHGFQVIELEQEDNPEAEVEAETEAPDIQIADVSTQETSSIADVSSSRRRVSKCIRTSSSSEKSKKKSRKVPTSSVAPKSPTI